jgi:hypothetical protein
VTLLGKLQAWKNLIVESNKVHGDMARAEKMISSLDILSGVLLIRISTDEKLEEWRQQEKAHLLHPPLGMVLLLIATVWTCFLFGS